MRDRPLAATTRVLVSLALPSLLIGLLKVVNNDIFVIVGFQITVDSRDCF